MTEVVVSVVLLGVMAVLYGNVYGANRSFLGNVGFFNTASQRLDVKQEQIAGVPYRNEDPETSLAVTDAPPASLSASDTQLVHTDASPVIFEYTGAPSLGRSVGVQGTSYWWVRENQAQVVSGAQTQQLDFKRVTLAVAWSHMLYSGQDPIEEIVSLGFDKFEDFINMELASSTIAVWPMDYTDDSLVVTGNARDISRNAMHLIVPQPNPWTDGLVGKAFAYDALPLYVDGDFFPENTAEWTFETWIGPLKQSGTYTLFSYQNSSLTITRKSPGDADNSNITFTLKGLDGAGAEATEVLKREFFDKTTEGVEFVEYDPGPYWVLDANSCFSSSCNDCDPISCNDDTCPLEHCNPQICDPVNCEDCAKYFTDGCTTPTEPMAVWYANHPFCATAQCDETTCFHNGLGNAPCDPGRCDAGCGTYQEVVTDCLACDRANPCVAQTTCTSEVGFSPHFLDAYNPDSGTEGWIHVTLVIKYGQYIKLYIHTQEGRKAFYAYLNTHLKPRSGRYRFSLGSAGLVMDEVHIARRELFPSDFHCGNATCE